LSFRRPAAQAVSASSLAQSLMKEYVARNFHHAFAQETAQSAQQSMRISFDKNSGFRA